MTALQTSMVETPELESLVRPLLRLIQCITGLETSFVTRIDWEQQQQDVIFSLNSGELKVIEGSRVNWVDSMCRSVFLTGRQYSSDVGGEVPATAGAVALGMKSFFALPVLVAEKVIATVCGASQRRVALSEKQIEMMQLIADAMQMQMTTEYDRLQAVARAQLGEQTVDSLRVEAIQLGYDMERMQKMANTDSLTGLPNRRAFTAHWEDELARSARRGHAIALILIDADRFKAINDSRGHALGDTVLQTIAKALREVSSSSEMPARLGGDEFALALPYVDCPGLLATAASIRSAFAELAKSLKIECSLSIGIASSEFTLRSDLFAAADAALYRAKERGGDCAELWTDPSDHVGTRK